MPGTRVKVRFAGQLVDGWLLERADVTPSTTGSWRTWRRWSRPEPVLAPEVARLARAVADRYAGTLADVLRLAVPPRHARAEEGRRATPTPRPTGRTDRRPADRAAARRTGRGGGPARLAATTRPGRPSCGRSPTAGPPARSGPRCPARTGPARYAEAVAATVAGGRGAVVVVADARDLDRLDAALTAVLGAGRHVCLSAAARPGPALPGLPRRPARRGRRW